MGAGGSVVTGFDILEIDAPAETVWATIADLDASPFIFRAVTSFKRTGGGKFDVGTTWEETRTHNGGYFVLRKTITEIVNNEKERSVSIAVNFTASNPWQHHACITRTSTVMPVNASSCQLILTSAFCWASLWGKIKRIMCCSCIRCMIQRTILAELSDYEAAAIQRDQESKRAREYGRKENEKNERAANSQELVPAVIEGPFLYYRE
jgi:hypothetical protein